MREITSHKVNPANDLLEVQAVDGPGPGGASHRYEINGPDFTVPVVFQNGPIGVAGINGITHEALLAILIDRIEGFQAGPFADGFNKAALDHLRAATACLHARTRERMARGVEGTHKV